MIACADLVAAGANLQVAEAIASAVERGLNIPIIYNTSSYDALSSLALMDGLVDIVSAHVLQCRAYLMHACKVWASIAVGLAAACWLRQGHPH